MKTTAPLLSCAEAAEISMTTRQAGHSNPTLHPRYLIMARGPAVSGVGSGGMSEPARKAEMLFETSTIAEIREVGADILSPSCSLLHADGM